VYGSPNNVGLYLGRALPVLAAVALLGGDARRRIAYGLGILLVLPAVVLSFSKGALLLGVPASLAVVGVAWVAYKWRGGGEHATADGGRPTAGGQQSAVSGQPSRRWWAWVVPALAIAAAALGAGLLLRMPRFANLFDLGSGTAFFRVRLWGSALAMIRDHPWLGVGPDNFLYAYRGGYINPEAWQEPNLSHAHNFALDFASRLGLPGLAAFLWMQVAFFRRAWLVFASPRPSSEVGLSTSSEGWGARALAVGLAASMIDFLAHGLVDASYFFVDLAFAYFLTLGLMARLNAPREG
jgi:O-antigen ligase